MLIFLLGEHTEHPFGRTHILLSSLELSRHSESYSATDLRDNSVGLSQCIILNFSVMICSTKGRGL